MRSSRSCIRQRRRGLAPLELTLALPLLLMVMALMVIMGTAGAWKVRTLANSRQAIFRAMHPRDTDNDPHPDNWWPSSTMMAYHNGGTSFLSSDPYAGHDVVRGPNIADPNTGNSLRVLINTLDMRNGMNSGEASVDHDPPMLAKLGVRNSFRRNNVMFAGQTWQYNNLGIPSNRTRRILYTYDFEMSKYNQQAAAQVRAAESAIRSNPHRADLVVLDRDAELRAHFGRYSDFYPRPAPFCSHNPLILQRDVLPPLLEAIDNVPRAMTNRFLQMYQEQLQALEAQNPPPPDYNQRKAALEQLIQQLLDFRATLP